MPETARTSGSESEFLLSKVVFVAVLQLEPSEHLETFSVDEKNGPAVDNQFP